VTAARTGLRTNDDKPDGWHIPIYKSRNIVNTSTLWTEAEFQETVIEIARALGWRVSHTHDSRRSNPGFPDLTLVRNGVLLFMELKSEKGKPTQPQIAWLIDLGKLTTSHPDIHVGCFRPSDMPRIRELLT